DAPVERPPFDALAAPSRPDARPDLGPLASLVALRAASRDPLPLLSELAPCPDPFEAERCLPFVDVPGRRVDVAICQHLPQLEWEPVCAGNTQGGMAETAR